MNAAQARRLAAAHPAQHYQAILQAIKESALAGALSVINPHSAIDPQPEQKQLVGIWEKLREDGYVVEYLQEFAANTEPSPLIIVRW